MPAWEPSWNLYMANVDGTPHSFVLDMAAAEHAPVATHPLRVQVRVRMARARSDGLRDASEMDALGKVEDTIVARVVEALQGIYVGRFLGAGFVTFVFYVPERADSVDQAIADLDLRATVRPLGPYEPEWLSEVDTGWTFYLEFLYPDPVSFERMLNRDQLRHREELGDCLDLPRTIDHLVVFTSREAADGASRALASAGFQCDPVQESAADDGGSPDFRLEVHRDERLDDNRPDAFCAEIRALVAPFDGDYDGWGGPIVKP
jgi:regulator of RNase E activity RraB